MEKKRQKADERKSIFSNKNDVIRTLQIIYENHDSKSLRISCLKVISHLDRNAKALYKFFENVAISDSEKNVRFKALKIIIKNYPKKGAKLFQYLTEKSESRYVLTDLYECIVYNIRHIKNDLIPRYKVILDKIDTRFYEMTNSHITGPYKS